MLQDPKSQLEQDVGNDKPLARKTTFKQSHVILCLPDTRGSKLLVLCYSALKNIMTDCRHASNKLAELVPFQFMQDKTGFRKLLPTTAGEFDFLLPSLHVWAMSHWPRRLSGAANSVHTQHGSYVGGVGCALVCPLVLRLWTVQTCRIAPYWPEPPPISLWSGGLVVELITAIVTGKTTHWVT